MSAKNRDHDIRQGRLALRIADLADKALRRACSVIVLDDRFFFAPAAAVKHQAYVGGLADHTEQVLDIALAMASSAYLAPLVSKDVIIASVLWHDYGKIWDYVPAGDPRAFFVGKPEKSPDFSYTRHRYSVRHLSRSHAEFMIAAREAGVGDDLCEEVSHCILSHHGRQEWGSPMEPLTPEATIIHFADTVSARCLEPKHMFGSRPGSK